MPVGLHPAGDSYLASRTLVVHVRDVAGLAHHVVAAWLHEHIRRSGAAYDAELWLSQGGARRDGLDMHLVGSLDHVLSL